MAEIDWTRESEIWAERPGMQRKQIPLGFAANGDLLSGGRYLFESRQQAEQYKDCGNKVCDLGEDNQKCPGDCRVP